MFFYFYLCVYMCVCLFFSQEKSTSQLFRQIILLMFVERYKMIEDFFLRLNMEKTFDCSY